MFKSRLYFNTSRKYLKMSLSGEKRSLSVSEQVSKKPNLAASPVPGEFVSKKTLNKKGKIRRKYTKKNYDPTNTLGVLLLEVSKIFSDRSIPDDKTFVDINRVLNNKEILDKYNRTLNDVEVIHLSSKGDGLALISHPEIPDGYQVAVIPFAMPGETVDIRIFRTHPTHCEADLLKVHKESLLRNDSLINCSYFGKCSGCQFQNIEYSTQLDLKRQTIVNAYQFFAKTLDSTGQIPAIEPTVASPQQYHYRTKLTPHFDLPRGKFNPDNIRIPELGFAANGRPEWRHTAGGKFQILDIEECPIGTPILNQALKVERLEFLKTWKKFPRGGTVLLRENTRKMPKDASQEFINLIEGTRDPATGNLVSIQENNLVKTCTTESQQIVSEIIQGKQFDFYAREFFQNNNAILPVVIDYVKKHLFQAAEPYLIDAYCGSGLFGIMCSDAVTKVVGVEVSKASAEFAERNAKLNNVTNALFIVGKAEQIFQDITLPPDTTSVICDPPRKGCDELFLNQLSDFHPATIIYISCNVHSQARDLEFFINQTASGKDYKIQSIRGFDFFPQTHHVESVAILSRI